MYSIISTHGRNNRFSGLNLANPRGRYDRRRIGSVLTQPKKTIPVGGEAHLRLRTSRMNAIVISSRLTGPCVCPCACLFSSVWECPKQNALQYRVRILDHEWSVKSMTSPGV